MSRTEFGGWPVVERLGRGGQGIVYLVRDPGDIDRDAALTEEFSARVRDLAGPLGKDLDAVARGLLDVLSRYLSPRPATFGAAKHFQIPTGPEADEARKRLRREIELWGKMQGAGVLRLIAADASEDWMITEYCQRKTLEENPGLFSGRSLEALEAFRPLVAALCRLHGEDVVHRDVKPANIFVRNDGQLVLGDFGIVFFQDPNGDRLTETFERVGSRDWMAPWAHTGRRIASVSSSFDVFSLGKLLWAMASGQSMLPFWYFEREEYNLERLYPEDRGMPIINAILRRSIVEHESDCYPNAGAMLNAVDKAIAILRNSGQLMSNEVARTCRVCGTGKYEPLFARDEKSVDRVLPVPSVEIIERGTYAIGNILERPYSALTVRVFRCEQCGHVDLFQFSDRLPPRAWGLGAR